MRTLVAGFGNVLRGDDGFGVAVVNRLAADPPAGVELMEVGTGGLRLAQELLGGYGRLVIVDAMHGGGEPGTLYVRAVESVAAATDIDMHLAVPSRALAVASALGSLPAEIYLVGCEPAEVDELLLELTPRIAAAVDRAAEEVRRLATGAAQPSSANGGRTAPPGEDRT